MNWNVRFDKELKARAKREKKPIFVISYISRRGSRSEYVGITDDSGVASLIRLANRLHDKARKP